MHLFYMSPLWPERLQNYFILEAVLLFINFGMFVGLIILTCRVKLHVNLKIFGVYMEVQYFPVIIGRLLIIGYESKLFTLEGSPEQNWIIVWSSYLRCHYSALAVTVIFWFAVERQFAIYFIYDYEKKPRYWIPALLIACSHSLATFASYLFAFEVIPWEPLLFFGLTNNMIGFLLFCHTYKKTRSIVNDLNQRRKNSMHIYTLSLRFQLQENLWCAQVLRNAFITLALVNVFTALFFLAITVPYFSRLLDLQLETIQLMDCIFNILIAVNGPVIAAGAIFYNGHLVKTMKGIFFAKKRGVEPEEKKMTDDGQVYFIHLRQQWGVQGNEEEKPTGKEKGDQRRKVYIMTGLIDHSQNFFTTINKNNG